MQSRGVDIIAARTNIINRFKNIKRFSSGQTAKFKLALIENFRLPQWYADTLLPAQAKSIYELMKDKYNGFGEINYFSTHNTAQLKDILNRQFKVPGWFIDLLSTKQMRDICEIKIVIQTKVDYMNYHEYDVSQVAGTIAPFLGFNGSDKENLVLGALFHDIGKKNTASVELERELTQEEKEIFIDPHPVWSSDIFADYPVLKDIADWVKFHHKHWCGKGYPKDIDIKEENIPKGARVIAIADCFHAMLERRAYNKKEPKTIREACIELIELAGFQFDPYIAFKAASILSGLKRIDYTRASSHDYVLPQGKCSAIDNSEHKFSVYEGKKKQLVIFDDNHELISVHGVWTIRASDLYQPDQITTYYLKGILRALHLENLDYVRNVQTPIYELLANAIEHGCWEDKLGKAECSDEFQKRTIQFTYKINKDKLTFEIYYLSKEFDIKKAFTKADIYHKRHRGLRIMVKDFVDGLEYKYSDGHYTVSGEIPLSTPKNIREIIKQRIARENEQSKQS